jgi:hypothetical protein
MFAAVATAMLLGAVMSASASAEACVKKSGSKQFTLCVEGQKHEGEERLFAQQASPTVVYELPEEWKEPNKPPMALVCSVLAGQFGFFEATAQLFFERPRPEECALQNSVKCRAWFHQLRSTVGLFGASSEHVLVSPSERVFAELVMANAEGQQCPTAFLNGVHNFTGRYECKLTEAELESVLHELRCESQGRETLFHERPAHIRYTQTMRLDGSNDGKKFSIYER